MTPRPTGPCGQLKKTLRSRLCGWTLRTALVCTLVATLFCPAAASCNEDHVRSVDFDRDIRPILAEHCVRCHGPDARTRKADLRLDRRASVYTDRGGYRVVDGQHPEQSELLVRITSDDPELRMPPADLPAKDQLTRTQIDLVARWLKQGARWAQHWSFVLPKRPQVPHVNNVTWPRSGLDYFVLKRLEQEGLEPSPPAAGPRLLRRATLALTGVPPTVEEIDLFLADPSPNAYEQAVERLLASPRYGEHLTLAWLDAARYADTSGYQADWERFMWPWRDWVVDAYNANMPFDQFTVEQLAGDLLPAATLSQRLATGFNRNHRTNDEGGSLDAEFEVEYVVDRVDTTSTVWLGLTTGCARCHDHKYDPVSQKEYYRLFAFFNNVPEKGIDGRKGAAVPYIEVPNQRIEVQLVALRDRLKRLQSADGDGSRPQTDLEKREIAALQASIKELNARTLTQVQIMQERPQRRATYLLQRGAYDRPDKSETLAASLPAVLGALPAGAPADRLALARWLVSPENPLTARVTTNRIWQFHFGVGIVPTAENFGTRGERPSHPQLLDWLAIELVRLQWDIKALHRMIVTSATFRQSSRVTPKLLQRDPVNRLLARGPRQRLSGAAIRDHALFVSGLLSQTMGGSPLKPYQPAGLWKELSFASGKTSVDFYVQDHGASLYRRSLYTFWKRTVAPPRMSVFDGTGREMCRVRTELTNTPMQALTLQNDVTFVEAARHLARRMLREGGETPVKQLTYGWRLALGRPPDGGEITLLQQALSHHLAIYNERRDEALRLLGYGESPRDEELDVARHAAYTMIAQTILNLDETIVRD